jgi:hypothetical protein
MCSASGSYVDSRVDARNMFQVRYLDASEWSSGIRLGVSERVKGEGPLNYL